MYALIYDEHDLYKPKKRIISVHYKRNAAENALETRKRKLGKKVWECNTRVVWINGSIKSGEYDILGQYSNWRPGEEIPEGEFYSDED